MRLGREEAEKPAVDSLHTAPGALSMPDLFADEAVAGYFPGIPIPSQEEGGLLVPRPLGGLGVTEDYLHGARHLRR